MSCLAYHPRDRKYIIERTTIVGADLSAGAVVLSGCSGSPSSGRSGEVNKFTLSAEELNQLDTDFTTAINGASPASLDWIINDSGIEDVLLK